MASIREVMCGAKRQGRMRCIVEIDSPQSLVNFYISIKPILGFELEPSEEVFFLEYYCFNKNNKKEKKRIKVKPEKD